MTTPMRKRDLPFPRHWLSYIALKLLLLAVAVAIALHLFGLF